MHFCSGNHIWFWHHTFKRPLTNWNLFSKSPRWQRNLKPSHMRDSWRKSGDSAWRREPESITAMVLRSGRDSSQVMHCVLSLRTFHNKGEQGYLKEPETNQGHAKMKYIMEDISWPLWCTSMGLPSSSVASNLSSSIAFWWSMTFPDRVSL